MEIKVRPAENRDLDEWLRMRLLLWPDNRPEDFIRDMSGMLADVETPVFVAERPAGGLCGFLEGGTRPYADGCDTAPVGYIEGWFVDEDVRRAGVGASLVTAMETWSKARGLKEMASDTWLENETSIQAHLALGYEESERLVHFRKTL